MITESEMITDSRDECVVNKIADFCLAVSNNFQIPRWLTLSTPEEGSSAKMTLQVIFVPKMI